MDSVRHWSARPRLSGDRWAATTLALVVAVSITLAPQAIPVARGASVWSIEAVDIGGFVGRDSSLALDAAGNPHISYVDDTNRALKYAAFDGTIWQVETVDLGGAGATRSSSSLALDAAGNPHISYNGTGSLKYARFDGTSWLVETVADTGIGASTSLALDAASNPHISYLDATEPPFPDFDLRYAHFDGTAWQLETVDSDQVGAFSSLAIDSGGNAHISYWDSANNDLRYARFDGVAWHVEAVDSAGNVGASTSLALDAAGNPHISYLDVTNGNVKYARFDGSTWQLETVDSAANNDLATGAPASTSLALEAGGQAHISYYAGVLRYARYDGSAWQLETVDDAGDVGSWSSLALDADGLPHISYVDGRNGNLKYAAGLGPGSGQVDARVDVQKAAACLVVSAKTVNFGTLPLGAENVEGAPEVSLTNCAEDEETIFVSGTDASGTGASWSLVPTGVCGDGSLSIDTYRLSLQPEGANLSTANKLLGTLGAGDDSTHTAHIHTACPGSTGAGETMNMQIIFVATAP